MTRYTPKSNDFSFVVFSVIFSLLVLAGCGAQEPEAATSSVAPTKAQASQLEKPVTLLSSSDPAELALSASKTFFATAPVVVLARADDTTAQATAAAATMVASGPVLLVGGGVPDEEIRAELTRLNASTVVEVTDDVAAAMGSPSAGRAPLVDVGSLRRVHLDAGALVPATDELNPSDLQDLDRELPKFEAPKLVTEVLALTDGKPAQAAAVATARAAGAVPVVVPGGNPMASQVSIDAISSAKALAIVAIGASFGDQATVEWRVRAAESGVQLPGGGQLVTVDRRYVTTVTKPLTSSGKPLDEEAMAKVVEGAQEAAASYTEGLAPAPVIPAMEIPLPTITRESAKLDAVAGVQALVSAAEAAGVYTVVRLDSATSLTDQITTFAEVFQHPAVGLAIDTDKVPRTSRAGVERTDAIGEAITAIADLTRTKGLPQKLLVLQAREFDQSIYETADRGEVAPVWQSTASGGFTTRTAAWQELHSQIPSGLPCGWTTAGSDPASDVDGVLAVDPLPEYIVGGH